jgi:hypothetical protein
MTRNDRDRGTMVTDRNDRTDRDDRLERGGTDRRNAQLFWLLIVLLTTGTLVLVLFALAPFGEPGSDGSGATQPADAADTGGSSAPSFTPPEPYVEEGTESGYTGDGKDLVGSSDDTSTSEGAPAGSGGDYTGDWKDSVSGS